MTVAANAVLSDLTTFRSQLRSSGAAYQRLLQLSPSRPLFDIAVDWLVVTAAVLMSAELSWWLSPVSLIIIGNRQRALGNILHDGGHRNIHRSRAVNDTIVSALVAPLVFADLASYRSTHFRHHLELGDRGRDPDYIAPPAGRVVGWKENYLRNVCSAKAWWGSLVGHLASSNVPWRARLYIAAWWSLFLVMITAVAGSEFMLAFLLLWFFSRATVFHLITTFREMCDHFGLEPGGIASFTRDVVSRGLWSTLLHPRNNGYHLTHHLLPAVPYYRLPAAQRLLADTPMYQRTNHTFASYVLGERPAVAAWCTGERR